MDFINNNFLLESDVSAQIYHAYAKNLPIIDYHSHLNPEMIAKNSRFDNITQIWLGGDHYKWRLMRNCGVDERLITGSATDADKFAAFAGILPLCIGNPIYIWCHLELKRYFGFSGALNAGNALEVYEFCNKKIREQGFSVKALIKQSKVEVICTTDDPVDNLEFHKEILSDKTFNTKVLPTFRPDKAVHIENKGFPEYITALEKVCGFKIKDITDLLQALEKRLDYFIENSCFISDHALNEFIYEDCNRGQAQLIFNKALRGEKTNTLETEQYQTFVLKALSQMYCKKNIAMQLHYNCLRNNNSNMFSLLGADTGFDCINCSPSPQKLSLLLDSLERENSLPKTIIYSLNPNDDRLINTIINCFQGKIRGKLQHGSAWWFNDTKFGMKEHIKTLSESSVLGNFIGMLTDSRSFLSYARHEYFRRILCDFIGAQIKCGEYPSDEKDIKMLVENICYYNAKNYFEIY